MNDLINKVGGIEKARKIVSKAPSNAESYQGGYYFRELPQFMFHNGFHDQWNLTDNDGLYFKAAGFHPVRIDDLRTAIAENYQDFEQFLTDNDMPIRKGKDGYLFSNRLVYDAWVKSPELGLKKIHDLKNTKIYLQGGMKQLESSDCTDIRNHLSPNCKVMERNNESCGVES